jgi:hypothetical protein
MSQTTKPSRGHWSTPTPRHDTATFAILLAAFMTMVVGIFAEIGMGAHQAEAQALAARPAASAVVAAHEVAPQP